jgi:hypothetical protein
MGKKESALDRALTFFLEAEGKTLTPQEIEKKLPRRRGPGVVWELRQRGHKIEQVKDKGKIVRYTLIKAATPVGQAVYAAKQAEQDIKSAIKHAADAKKEVEKVKASEKKKKAAAKKASPVKAAAKKVESKKKPAAKTPAKKVAAAKASDPDPVEEVEKKQDAVAVKAETEYKPPTLSDETIEAATAIDEPQEEKVVLIKADGPPTDYGDMPEFLRRK